MCGIVFLSFSFILLLALHVQCLPPTIRQTSNGPVEGREQMNLLGQKYYSFRGIPFAEPPITGRDPYTGRYVDRRFKPTNLLKCRWTTPRNAKNDGKSCYQISVIPGISPDPADVSEDCLFLNIYVPAGGAKRKTVLVYIHSGSFFMGDATDRTYGPEALLSRDNVVVKMQYRVGIFGFMNLNDGIYTGNMGLKDQQLALQWIYENIENFSGKKDEILLMGLSSGGSCVQYQMVNKISRKYFKRAFAMSSTAYSSYALRKASHLPEVQQCTQIYDMNKLIAYLKTAPSNAFDNCYPWTYPDGLHPIWVPTIESPCAPKAFLTKSVDEIYSSDDPPRMDAMFSFTPSEMITFLPNLLQETQPLIKENGQVSNIFTLPFEGLTKETFPQVYTSEVEQLRQAYFPDTSSVDAIRSGNIALESDAVIIDGVMKAVVRQAEANHGSTKCCSKNTFLYRFNVLGALNLNKNLSIVGHADDMCYVFQCNSFDPMLHYAMHYQQRDIDYDVIQRLMTIISNFARTGNPSIEGDTPFKSCRPGETFCQEFSKEPPTHTIVNIREIYHYKLWRKLEATYDKLGICFPRQCKK